MTGHSVNGGGNGARSGAQTLVLLAVPLNVAILRCVAEGPKQQVDLRRETDSPAQTTLRAQLKRLVEIGALAKHRRNRFPGVLEYELTTAGHDLIAVIAALEAWLLARPERPLLLNDNAARSTVRALAEGWSSTMLRALAARPLALTELDRIITSLSYPSLERRLGAMRLAGLVAPAASGGRGTPYEVTDWMRRGVIPLAAAARWERTYAPVQTPPISSLDIEAAALLALPLVRLSDQTTASFRLAVELTPGRSEKIAGAIIKFERGRVVGCSTRLEGRPDAWALGSAAAWLSMLFAPGSAKVDLGGDRGLCLAVIDGLHSALDANPLIRDDGAN